MGSISGTMAFMAVLCIGLKARLVSAQLTNLPQELVINSGRPTFYDVPNILPGKIALEEHVGNTLFSGSYTTPFVNHTNEINLDIPVYIDDAGKRLNDVESRITAMNAANISMNIVMFGAPGIQGIFNTSYATYAAAYVNDELSRVYKNGNHSSRFGFWCSNALQDPPSAAVELERCVKQLGGVGSFVGGYTNIGSANNIVYLDDPINEPFLAKAEELDVPIYLHPRTPAPDQQRVYQDYWILAAAPHGFAADTSAHVLRLMLGGVFDRHPNLKIILGHAGEGLPFFLSRIEARLRHAKHAYPAKHNVTYYWDNNFYVTTSGIMDSAVLRATLAASGEDRTMFSVDYPFEDDTEISVWFDNLDMAQSTKEKVGWQNARRILKLDGAESLSRRYGQD